MNHSQQAAVIIEELQAECDRLAAQVATLGRLFRAVQRGRETNNLGLVIGAEQEIERVLAGRE